MFEPTIKDIAKICGVGVSTVSRAINNHPDINPGTRDKILETIKEYGYVPNDSARNLKRSDAKAIAVLAKGIATPFFTNMIAIIEQECKKRGYAMELTHIEFDEDEVDAAQKAVKEKRLRGIIFLGGYFSRSEEKLKKLNVPFVFSTAGGIPDNISKDSYSNIGVDDRLESGRMVDYLISLGHEKIAIIAAEAYGECIGNLRLEGYFDALEKHGIAKNERLIFETDDTLDRFSMENGYITAKRLIESGEKFSAVYAVSDTLAIGACRALREAGLAIPEDVSVAGYDGIDMGNYVTPRLTTMRQPVEEMARATIKLLFDIIMGLEGHRHMVYEAELVKRESTKQIAAKGLAAKEVCG